MPIIKVESRSHFKELIRNSKEYVLVDFSAKWCGPCKRIEPKLEELSERYNSITFLKVDVDQLESLSEKYDIKMMPTFLIFSPGNLVSEYKPIEGADLDKIKNMLKMLTNKEIKEYDF